MLVEQTVRADSFPSVEKRSETRQKLVLRAAKLICAAGEKVCVARDISPGGLKVKMLNRIDGITNCAIEFVEGQMHPLAKVWERDGYAGFRFLKDVDPESILGNNGQTHPKRALRLVNDREAIASDGLSNRRGRIINISQTGACIESSGSLSINHPITIRCAGLPDQKANLRWSNGSKYGLMFCEPISLERLARYQDSVIGTG